MADRSESPFLLAEFLVEPSLNRISGSGRDERVPLKMMQVLLVLAERPGSVVERDELMDRIWGDTIVEEAVLTRAVSDLRKVLDDSGREQSVIETIPKVGYRLVAPVQPATGGDSQADHQIDLPSSFELAVRPTKSQVDDESADAGDHIRWPAIRWLSLIAAPLVAIAIWLVFRTSEPPASTSAAPVPVTSLNGAEFEPAISPGGQRVAFSRDAAGDGNVDLFVLDRNGTGLQRLTTHSDRDVGAAWSPDGLRIAFLRKGADECSIRAVPVGGGPDTRLASCRLPANDNLDWSPDGRLLAYSARPTAGESFSIFVVDLETGEEKRVSRPTEQHWGDRFPRFSPDGSAVAFSRSVSIATQDVFLVELGAERERAVTTDHRAVGGLDWTSDGSGLLVATNRSGVDGLWRVPIDGSEPVWIAQAGSGVRQPTVSASGRVVVYMQVTDVSDIMTYDPESGRSAPAAALTSSRFDAQPAFSPDGSQVAFSSNRSGSQEIWVGPAHASSGDGAAAAEVRRLTSLSAGFTGSPAWSPDGRRIAFDARPNGQPDIYVIDAAGGVPRQLTRSAASDFSPAFSADGKSLFFGSNRSGDWQIWRIVVKGGEGVAASEEDAAGEESEEGAARQVTTDGGFAVRVGSVSGHPVLIHTRYDREGLWIIPADGGEAEQLPLPAPLIDHQSFAVRNGQVHAVITGGDMIRLDLTSGRVETIDPGQSAGRKMGLTVAPDGTILFGHRGPSSSDLMLLEL